MASVDLDYPYEKTGGRLGFETLTVEQFFMGYASNIAGYCPNQD